MLLKFFFLFWLSTVSDVSRCGCLCVLLHGIQWNSRICIWVFSTKYGMIPALFHYISSFFPLLTPTGSLCYICWWAWCFPTGIFLHFLQTFTFTLLFRLDFFYWFFFIHGFFSFTNFCPLVELPAKFLFQLLYFMISEFLLVIFYCSSLFTEIPICRNHFCHIFI